MNTAIVIMSKIPLPGHTKTRLMPELTSQECVEFHRACLNDIVHTVSDLDLPLFLYYAPIPNEYENGFDFRDNNWWGLDNNLYACIEMYPQIGKDLGERMYNAAQEITAEQRSVLFLGSDLPDLPGCILEEAAELLVSNDVVLGPAEDGGYYLLGIKKAHSFLFDNISWGSSEVLAETLNRIQKNGLSTSLLARKRDIDTWKDIKEYYLRGQQDIETRDLHSYRIVLKIMEHHLSIKGGIDNAR